MPVCILAHPRMPWLVISVQSHLIYAHISHWCKLDMQYLYTFLNAGLNDSPSKTKLMMLKSNMQIFSLWQWRLQEAAKNPVSLVRPINLFIVNNQVNELSLFSCSQLTSNYFHIFQMYSISNIYFELWPDLWRYFVNRSWTHTLLRHFFKTH